MKVHLVDGTYELFRAFYGNKHSERAPDGRDLGATRQLMRSMLTLLSERDVTHVASAFDTEIESFRNRLFDGYKSGEGIDADLKAQFPLAERATAAMGIVVWGLIEFEADDGIAAGVAKYALDERVQQVVICSPDKDMSQCVIGDRVVARDRMRNIIRNEQGVIDKYGVAPASIPDWLALVGDSADGIPGIPRWGAKGAAQVLQRYRFISEIPDDAADWDIKVRGAASLANNLREQRTDAVLYRKLATLRTDVPLNESLDDLEWRGADRAELALLCAELGYEEFLDQIPKWRET
jgi:5'-3' exonuclease